MMPAKPPIDLAKARAQKRRGGGVGETSPPFPHETGAPCPVTALGHRDGKFWFLNIVGEKRELSDRQLGQRSPITGLFMGDMIWLESQRRFMSYDAEGNSKGWSVVRTMEFLMDACRRAGVYGDHVVTRRPGVWPGEGGDVIAHCGDAVFINGEKFPAGEKIAGQIFVASARETHPATLPADASVARDIAEKMRSLWRLRHDGAEKIAIGLVGQGYYAAALSWRSNGFIAGGTNSGKSHFLDLMRRMVPLHVYSNDPTKAGIEGAVGGKALPSFIDEGFDTGGDAAATLINIVLAASSGEGTKGHRGTADGGVRSIEVVGSAIMASVNAPALQPQHRSRFSIIELVRPEAGIDHKDAMLAAIEGAKRDAPALFARALCGFARFKAALRVFRKALGAAGCVAREMDQVGAILAGNWMLTEDGVPDEETAAEDVKIIAEGFVLGAEEMARDSAPEQVLNMILSRVVNLDRSTDQESIGRLIEIVMQATVEDDIAGDNARRVLSRWGIRPVRADQVYDRQNPNRLVPRKSVGNGLWIDHRWQPLKGIFSGSPYDGDRWFMELRRLDKAMMSDSVVRISALKSARALWISWEDGGDGHDSG